MSFNFGNTPATGLGVTSTPAKPPSFGSLSFGGTSAPPTFGSNTQSNTTFGGAPAFGTGFGTTTSAAPNFGFGSVQPTTAASAAPTFGFGSNLTTSAPTFGGFGTGQTGQATTSTAPASFGYGSFSQPTNQPLGGGLGTSTFSGFGTTPANTGGFGSFGQQASTAPLFGGLGGTATTSVSTGFGSSFGTLGGGGLGTSGVFGGGSGLFTGLGTQNTTSGFGGFGTSNNPGFGTSNTGFGQQTQFQFQQQQQLQQQQQQQQQPLTADEAFAQSIFNVNIFGDERDTLLAKWNYLQALWGSGKAFYSQNLPPVEITPNNYLCRLKTIGYTRIPGKENKIGHVAIVVNKPVTQIKDQQHQIVQHLSQIFGNKPNLIVNIESVKGIQDNKTQVIFFVEEKLQTSTETKRILATDVANFLNQPMTKTQLTNIGVENVFSMVLPDEDQLKEYLENPPKGVDPRLWKQAKEDNPDPSKFIPVPIIGCNELKIRTKCQENEIEAHLQYLAKIQQEITQLKQRHTNTTAKILEHRRKLSELSHRILKIIVKQESTRKLGVALSPEEEILRAKLENMQALVSAPTQFKGRLSELLSQMRMQRNQWNLSSSNEYSMDKDTSDEMKVFLTMQQNAMLSLIETANNDLKALSIISDGLSPLVRE